MTPTDAPGLELDPAPTPCQPPAPGRPGQLPERRRCRLCGREAWDTAFCTACLAETMEDIPR